MKENYETRLKKFESEKRLLDYKDLKPSEYQAEVRRIAEKYGI